MAPRAVPHSVQPLPPTDSPPTDWLLPTQAARLLGITKAGVRYLIKQRTFRARKDELGRNRLDPREVETYARTRGSVRDGRRKTARDPGQVAAAVFARLDQDESPRDICKAECLDPDVVLRLVQRHRQLETADGALAIEQQRERLDREQREEETWARRREAVARGRGGR